MMRLLEFLVMSSCSLAGGAMLQACSSSDTSGAPTVGAQGPATAPATVVPLATAPAANTAPANGAAVEQPGAEPAADPAAGASAAAEPAAAPAEDTAVAAPAEEPATAEPAAAEAPPEKDCVTKQVLSPDLMVDGLMTDFESYDGMVEASEWGFSFNGEGEDTTIVYAGPFAYDDATGSPFFGLVAGNGSTYGVSISNTMAEAYGGGLGFWMGCVDASAYSGVQFYARGSTPSGNVSFTLSMPNSSPPAEDEPLAGGLCESTVEGECVAPSVEFALSADWTLVQVPWADFAAGVGAAGTAVPVDGNDIAGMTFAANLNWIPDPADTSDEPPYVPEPAPYELVIDDLGFY